MSAFTLKIIALISMFIDHSAFVLFLHNIIDQDMYILLRGIGRLAFPIYCFLLVNGFRHTSNRQNYVYRLMLFAGISQLPFTMAFSAGNHFGAAFGAPEISFGGLPYIVLTLLFLSTQFLGSRKVSNIFTICLFTLLPAFSLKFGSVTVLGGNLNVFYTLSLGLALISLIDAARSKTLSSAVLILSAIAMLSALFIIQPQADYGITALLLICMLYFANNKKSVQALVICLWACIQYGFKGDDLIFTAFAISAVIPIAMYNDCKGRSLKYFFYIFYPAHLLLLGLSAFVL